MALLSKNKFKELAQERSHYCISVYIPTTREGDNQKAIIRLKNKLSEIVAQLYNLGLKRNDILTYIEPLNKLLDDGDLWRHLSDSLIIFRSAEDFNYTTLPVEVDELSLVSDRYYLLPLLSMFTDNDTFYLLTLSQNKNKLYEATKNEIAELLTEDVLPNKLEDSVGRDVKQKSLQIRSGQSQGGLGLYHGKGEGKDDKKKEIVKYLKDVDQGIKKLIDDESRPLVVASVDYIFSLFQEVSTYQNIFPTAVVGNYDDEDILLVHEKACNILQPWFEKERNKNREKYNEQSDKIISGMIELHEAAIAGSIETLFVERGNYVWGKTEPENGKIEINQSKKPLDNCLLDALARQTFLKGGTVFLEKAEKMPGQDSPANAILRY